MGWKQTGNTIGWCFQCGDCYTARYAEVNRIYWHYCPTEQSELSFCKKWCYDEYLKDIPDRHPKGYAICKGCGKESKFPDNDDWIDLYGFRCPECAD